MCLASASTTPSYYCSFVVSYEIIKFESPGFVVVLDFILVIQSPLHFHMNFKFNFVNFCPQSLPRSDKNYVDSVAQFKYSYHSNIKSPDADQAECIFVYLGLSLLLTLCLCVQVLYYFCCMTLSVLCFLGSCL